MVALPDCTIEMNGAIVSSLYMLYRLCFFVVDDTVGLDGIGL